MRSLFYFFTLACIALLPVRASEAGPGHRLADYCLGEVRAPGSYLIKAKGRIAEATPVLSSGATQAGAETLNNCIAKRALSVLPGYANERNRYLPVQEQRKAILACRSKLGGGGQVTFGARWREMPLSRQTDLWILPEGSLSADKADQINICADRTLNRPDTPRYGSGYKFAAAPRSGGGFCPKHASVLYGGTSYCVNN